MDLKQKVDALILDGKSDQEIAEKIVSEESAAKLSATEVADLVSQRKSAKEVSELLSAKQSQKEALEAKKAQEVEAQEQVKELVAKELKSIQINPSFSKSDSKITRRWDHSQKKFYGVDDVNFSEGYKVFNDLIHAMANRDVVRCKSISDEIAQDNKNLDTKATARSDSDAVGGYAIPTEVEGVINQLTYAESVMLPKVNTNVVIMEDKIYPTIGDTTMNWIADQDTAATESNPTFSNPTIAMKRAGLFTRVSNTLMRQKGADLTNAFMTSYASARARFLDGQLTIGNSTGNSDLLDGLVWLGTQETTPVALSSLSVTQLTLMDESIDNEVDRSRLAWIGNTKVRNELGALEHTGGAPIFPQFFSGGTFNPLGYEYIRNDKITNVLDVGGDDSTGGTDTALLLVDLSKFVVGIDNGFRIDLSTEESFTKDQTTFRGIERMGWQVLFSNICRVQELTGA